METGGHAGRNILQMHISEATQKNNSPLMTKQHSQNKSAIHVHYNIQDLWTMNPNDLMHTVVLDTVVLDLRQCIQID